MAVIYRHLAASFVLAISLGACGGGSGGSGGGPNPPPPPPPPPPPAGDAYRSPEAIGLERLRTASRVPINVRFEHGVPRWIRLDLEADGDSAEEAARAFLDDYQDLLGQQSLVEDTDRRQLHFETRYTNREDAPETFDAVRFAQTYDGVPVFGAEAVVGVAGAGTATGRVVTMSGRFMGAPRAPIDVIPAISEEQALEAARAHLALPAANASGPIERTVFDPLLGRNDGEPRLAWLVPIGGGEPHEMLIDAHDGSVLLANPLFFDAYDDFDLDLEDANGGTINGTNCFNPTTLDDTAGDEDGLEPAYSNDDDAHLTRIWAIQTANWYFNRFGQRSVDDDDAQLEVYIHSGIPTSKIGSYSGGCGIEFTTGGPSSDALTHEFTHGVIHYSSKLIYQYQSGALNESYADTMAAFGDQPADAWILAEDQINGAGVLRSLRDPPGPHCGPNQDELCGQPDKISDWVVTDKDNGGVHTNSGIMNKAHFLISQGQLSGPKIRGMGAPKARQLLYWSMKHLPKWAGFLDAREADIGYAEFFVDAGWFGMTSDDVCSVREAFAAVEIGFGDFDCDGVENTVDDPDGDFINSNVDNCPNDPNPGQWDGDQDGIGSVCDDDDDNDGIEDSVDNCPAAYNPGQQNIDGDIEGDACDPDDDNDNVLDTEDNCPGDPNPDQFDGNNNGWGDACDPDYDGDGFYTDLDNCNFVANPAGRDGLQADADGDGIGDACDMCPDVPDNSNAYTTGIPELGIDPIPLQPDSDGDGLPDACDDMPHGTTTLVSVGNGPPNPANPGEVGDDISVSVQGGTPGTFIDIPIRLCPPDDSRASTEDTDRIEFLFSGLDNALTASIIDGTGTRVAHTHELNEPVRGMRVRPDCTEHYVLRVEFGSDAEPDYDFDVSIVHTTDTGSNPWRGYERSANAYLAGLSASALGFDQVFQSTLFDYTGSVPFAVTSTTVTPTAEDAHASVTVNGVANPSGMASDPLSLAAGATQVTIHVVAENGVAEQDYSVTVTREAAASFAQTAYIKASNSGGGDSFGHEVAIDGDTMVVGAYLEDSNATGVNGDQGNDLAPSSGAAYVFTRDGSGTWSQQAYLKASNPDNNDEFGRRVAISGDTVVVSAPAERSAATGIDGTQADNSATGAGAVYVFTRDLAGLWSQQAYIKASNTSTVFPGDNFGESVSIDGDTLVVGASGEASAADGVNGDQSDITAEAAGAAYVYVRDGGGSWTQQAYIKASNSDTGEQFGSDVVIDGDTLAVSAMNEDSGATGINGAQGDESANGSGAVYVYTRDAGGNWAQQAYIKASTVEAIAVGDRFGISIDLDGDTLVVGANLEDSSATGTGGDEGNNSVPSAGAVYAFVRDAGTWSQQAYIKASNTALGSGSGGQFGFSVALYGNTLLVGAPNEASAATGIDGDQGNTSAAQAGAAYLFARDANGSWSQLAYVKASNTDSFDRFGQSVALEGTSSVIGASGEASGTTGVNGEQADNGAASAGAVYVFQ